MKETIIESVVVCITAMVIFFSVDATLNHIDSWLAWPLTVAVVILAVIAAEFVLERV